MTQPTRQRKTKARRPRKGGKHTRRKQSSIWLFVGIYSILTFTVVFAVFLLRLTSTIDDPEKQADATSENVSPVKKKKTSKSSPSKSESKKKTKASKPPALVSSKKAPGGKTEPAPAKATEPEPKATADKGIDVEKQILDQYPDPKITPLIEIVGNWQNIPPRAIPKMVAIRVPVEFEIKEGGQVVATGKLPIGATMTVTKLDNNTLSLSTGTSVPVTAALSMDETDLKQRIQARYDAFISKKMEVLQVQRDAERKRILKAIANEEALSVYNDGSDPRFAPLKASLRAGGAGATIEVEAAVKWKWTGKETIEGVEYDTAFVVIESETAFGLNEKEIKCALRDGKVEHWYDVRSGEKL